MKAQFTFQLPEDQELFDYRCQVMDYRSLINEFKNQLRSWDKMDHPSFAEVKEFFYELMEKHRYD